MRKTKKKFEWNAKTVLFLVLFIILAVYSLFLLYMIAWGIMSSLKSKLDFQVNVLGFPNLDKNSVYSSYGEFFKFENYLTVFKSMVFKENDTKVVYYKGDTLITDYATRWFPNLFGVSTRAEYRSATIIDMLINTILYAGGSALICALVPALTAYLCAKYPYKLSKIIFTVYTVIMCVPIVGAYPTELAFLQKTGLYNTLLGTYGQKMTGSGMYYFVYYAFYRGLSNTYREAAELDGASELRIMCNVFFPMSIKIIATVFLIQFVMYWNDYQTPLLYLPSWPTLAYAVHRITISPIKELNFAPVQIAASTMLALPVLVLFIIFKEKLMGNISLGGIKE